MDSEGILNLTAQEMEAAQSQAVGDDYLLHEDVQQPPTRSDSIERNLALPPAPPVKTRGPAAKSLDSHAHLALGSAPVDFDFSAVK